MLHCAKFMADGSTTGAREVTEEDIQRQLRALRMMQDVSLVLAAREDPNVFIEAIGRIEGGVWVGKQAGAHRMMHDHLTRAGSQPGASLAVLLAPVGHGKSSQTTRWRVVWELGRNPNLRVLIMSATTSLPEKMLAGIKGDITDNPFVAAVFPHLRPGHKKGQCDWSGSSIHVDRPDNLPVETPRFQRRASAILKRVSPSAANRGMRSQVSMRPPG